jgi:hypothetical protein
MGHLLVLRMPDPERGLRQMATRVIEHSITHILPDHERGLLQMATRVIEHSITHILPARGGLPFRRLEHSDRPFTRIATKPVLLGFDEDRRGILNFEQLTALLTDDHRRLRQDIGTLKLPKRSSRKLWYFRLETGI